MYTAIGLFAYLLIGSFIAGLQLADLEKHSEDDGTWITASIILTILWPFFLMLALGISLNKLLIKLKGNKDG